MFPYFTLYAITAELFVTEFAVTAEIAGATVNCIELNSLKLSTSVGDMALLKIFKSSISA